MGNAFCTMMLLSMEHCSILIPAVDAEVTTKSSIVCTVSNIPDNEGACKTPRILALILSFAESVASTESSVPHLCHAFNSSTEP